MEPQNASHAGPVEPNPSGSASSWTKLEKFLIPIAIVFAILSGLFGNCSYQRTKERDEAKTEAEKIKATEHIRIVKEPVYIHNRIAYRTVSTTDSVVDTNRSSADKTKSLSITTIKKGGIGLGVNAAFQGVNLIPKVEYCLTADVLTIPLIDLPLRIGISYIP